MVGWLVGWLVERNLVTSTATFVVVAVAAVDVVAVVTVVVAVAAVDVVVSVVAAVAVVLLPLLSLLRIATTIAAAGTYLVGYAIGARFLIHLPMSDYSQWNQITDSNLLADYLADYPLADRVLT